MKQRLLFEGEMGDRDWTYLIAYDINDQLRDYAPLRDAIQALGDWQHPMESVWFVKSDKSAADIAAVLKPHINLKYDHLFVTHIPFGAPSAGWMQKIFWRWLRK